MTTSPHGSDPNDDPGISGMGAQWEASLPWNQPSEPVTDNARHSRSRSSIPKPTNLRFIVLAVAAVAVVLVAALGIRALAGDDDSTDASPATAPATPSITLGRPAPPGWSPDVQWRATAPLNSDVAVSGNSVLYLTPSGSAVLLDATTGETKFSTVPTNLGGGEADVAIVDSPSGPTAVAWGKDTITAWPVNSTGSSVEGTSSRLPSGATIFVDGGGVLVSNSAGAWVHDGRRLVKMKVPAGASPLAALPDGSLVASPPAGPATVTSPNGKSTPIKLKKADGATGDTMYPARSAGGVLVAWAPTKDDATRAVAFYRVSDGALMAQGNLPTEVVNQGIPLAAAPDMSVAAAGPLLANLATGKTEKVNGWSTTIAVDDQLYGSVDGTRSAWFGKGTTETLDADAAVPWGVTKDGFAIVTEQVDGEQTLNGLVAD